MLEPYLLKCHPRGATLFNGALPGTFQCQGVEIQANHSSTGTHEITRWQSHIAYAAAHIQDLHPRSDACRTKIPLSVRAHDATLQHQALAFMTGSTENIVRSVGHTALPTPDSDGSDA